MNANTIDDGSDGCNNNHDGYDDDECNGDERTGGKNRIEKLSQKGKTTTITTAATHTHTEQKNAS